MLRTLSLLFALVFCPAVQAVTTVHVDPGQNVTQVREGIYMLSLKGGDAVGF